MSGGVQTVLCLFGPLRQGKRDLLRHWVPVRKAGKPAVVTP